MDPLTRAQLTASYVDGDERLAEPRHDPALASPPRRALGATRRLDDSRLDDSRPVTGNVVASPVQRRQSPAVTNIFLDERIARSYDESSADMFDPAVVEPAVDFLAALAGGAAGAGHRHRPHALPLSRRGVAVHGIGASPPMLEALRAKLGADQIGITIGDYATATVGATFRLAFAVFNAITNLTTQAEQVDCFRNVADHLEPGGCFVAETFVPALQRLPRARPTGRSR